MSSGGLDISDSMTWEDGLPLPQWELIETMINSCCEPDQRRNAWIDVLHQWLGELGPAFGDRFELIESDDFFVLAESTGGVGDHLIHFADRCRAVLLSSLDGVADFDVLGKQAVVAMRKPEDYYRYISQYYPEGRYGSTGGIHIREGYPHVALHGKQLAGLENTLAHELTHVSLHHLSMPQWLEEGLAQLFEHQMTGRSLLQVNMDMAEKHKRHWGAHGLDDFWRGVGFSRGGKVQELSYQLAEILVRLLIDESQPRWFGWDREPPRRFNAFLREATAPDCGEAACRTHLGFDLSDLAAKYLGSGSWSPSL